MCDEELQYISGRSDATISNTGFTPYSEDEVPEHGLVTELPVALRYRGRRQVAEQGELVVVEVLQKLRWVNAGTTWLNKSTK